jgi:hypothetical protein
MTCSEGIIRIEYTLAPKHDGARMRCVYCMFVFVCVVAERFMRQRVDLLF